jgi:hypothetical protein
MVSDKNIFTKKFTGDTDFQPDGRQAKHRKKGKKIFSSETTEPISTKLC